MPTTKIKQNRRDVLKTKYRIKYPSGLLIRFSHPNKGIVTLAQGVIPCLSHSAAQKGRERESIFEWFPRALAH